MTPESNNVLPIIRKGTPRKTMFPRLITPEQVHSLFVEACRGTRAKVPAVESCGDLADVLSALKRAPPCVVHLGLPPEARRALAALGRVLKAPQRDAARYRDVVPSNTLPEAATRLERIMEDAAWLLENYAQPPTRTWVNDLAEIDFHAWRAWASVMAKPPLATAAASPRCRFVQLALAAAGIHKSAETVSEALRSIGK